MDCIYLNLTNAIYKVDFRSLIAKIEDYVVQVQWTNLLLLDSYLKEGSLTVKFDGSSSTHFGILSGVSQGSHLRPLLFIIFTNDIVIEVLTGLLMCADDIKVYERISSKRGHVVLQH